VHLVKPGVEPKSTAADQRLTADSPSRKGRAARGHLSVRRLLNCFDDHGNALPAADTERCDAVALTAAL
jgi:hypothetical protein